VILGSFCGLRNVSQIHQWALSKRASEFLAKHFAIKEIPCYYWLLCLLKLIKPKSLNQCFINWSQSFLPEGTKDLTLSFDGKTIRSTGKMDKYDSPLHIVSAHVAEFGITIGQQTVDGKSNEIPAVRKLIELLKIEGCVVVADALNCQKETAKTIIGAKADYLLNVKDNQPILKENIEAYVQDEDLRKGMDTFTTLEKQSGRMERRTAFSTCDVDWLYGKDDWCKLACIGAVNRQFTTKKGATNEWHYYISSKELTAEELLKRVRFEWSVETMHWYLDVHFGEDFCRVEDKNVQENLNIVRKIALNSIKRYKEKTGDKRPMSKIMLLSLIDYEEFLPILARL
jgi:predicted transposase YbfD/YdcC